MDDEVDESCFLPEGVSHVTPERAAKGDLRIEYHDDGSIKYAKSQTRNVLNYLWNNQIITDEHHDAGHMFQAWRDQHRVAMGQQRAVSGDPDQPSAPKLRAYGFVLILQKLNYSDCRVIEQAIESIVNEHVLYFIDRYTVAYRMAFDRLVTILIPIKQRISYLEGLPPHEIEENMNEAKKLLLASFKNNR